MRNDKSTGKAASTPPTPDATNKPAEIPWFLRPTPQDRKAYRARLSSQLEERREHRNCSCPSCIGTTGRRSV